MATTTNVPDLHVPDEVRVGIFANAFRIVADTGDEVLLDFVVYSSSENKGVVVARIRAHKSFLNAIKERVESVVTGNTVENPPHLATPPEHLN